MKHWLSRLDQSYFVYLEPYNFLTTLKNILSIVYHGKEMEHPGKKDQNEVLFQNGDQNCLSGHNLFHSPFGFLAGDYSLRHNDDLYSRKSGNES